MRRRTSLVLCLGLLALSGFTPTAIAAADPPAARTLIQGSGSSWAANAVNQWIADVSRQGLQVAYTANGSASGRHDFAQDSNDFAVSDLPYQGTDPVTGQSDTSDGRDFAYIPLAAGATAFPYHLEIKGKRVTDLRLSGASLAGIFTGSIRYWNDPSIEKDNRHRLALPHLRITPVVHGEGSATSYHLADYLSTEYPSAWRKFSSPNTAPTPYWPAGNTTAQIENGSDGVMNYIESSAGNGSIGYDEYSYPLLADSPVVALQNQSGYFIGPSPDAVGLALQQATTNPDGTAELSGVYAAKDRRAYPLSSYSYAIVPTASNDPRMTTTKRNTIAAFLFYSLCQGQAEVSPIGYAPLPLNLVEDGMDGIHALGAADPGTDFSSFTAENCHNPTFVDGPPPHDILVRDAPNPPTCAAADHGPCGLPADASALTAPKDATIKRGAQRTLATQLTDRVTHGHVGGVAVSLWQRSGSGSWHRTAHGTTTASGAWSDRVRPSRSTTYQFRYGGNSEHAATHSPDTAIKIV